MPLNPPSWTGQDVWYSTNVFVNKVQVALWQPPQAMDSAMKKIPVIPSPSFEFNKQQQTASDQSDGDVEIDDDSPNAKPGAKVKYREKDGAYNGPTTTGVNPESLPPGVDPYSNFLKNLIKVKGEAEGGAWGNSGPNVDNMIQVTGVPRSPVLPHAWCATWVGYMLKISGLPFSVSVNGSKVSTLAADYQGYGQAVDVQNPNAWRQGDVMVVTRPGGYHVAFLWGLKRAQDNVVLLGGNQGSPSKVSATGWYSGTLSGNKGNKVYAVRRNWQIPTELDKPLA